ncbi:CHAT domain-containing protein [Paractinoplanes globisporus]|uniref:SAV_2336 N-terminal domain-related protein n=1 Tax=Paractinoplanes globisporus TaxID=113565 RepID=A0ABW6WX23_9ACTN|nr:CHAT domain-containing protein [Actinoplanes globisporus]
MTDLTALVRGLLAAGVAPEDLDVEVLRDALWMATVVAREVAPPPAPAAAGPPAAVGPGEPRPGPTPEPVEEDDGPPEDTETVGIHLELGAGEKPREGRPAYPVRIDAPAPLPSALALTRSLRPFRRARRTGRRAVLDAERTVRATVEAGGLLQPVMRSIPEPRFAAHLVVDDAASMTAWNGPLREFADVLRRANVFTTVERWRLVAGQAGPALVPAEGRRPIEVPWLRMSRDDVVLLATDARDERWRSDEWWQTVWTWAHRSSIALLNPLPPRWWTRTALPPDTVRIHTRAAARPNIALTARAPRRPRAGHDGKTVPLPVLTLAAGDFQAWSQMVASAHPDGCLGVLLSRDQPGHPPARGATGADAVAGFRRLAGRSAWRLAVLLSASEAHTYETMRIIQVDLMPRSSAADLAEVLAGGLLNAVPNGTATIFQFDPDARAELHGDLLAYDAFRVFQALRDRLEQQAGTNAVRALIEDPDATAGLPAGLRDLAAASVSALSSSGYTISAERRTRSAGSPRPDESPYLSVLDPIQAQMLSSPSQLQLTVLRSPMKDDQYEYTLILLTPTSDQYVGINVQATSRIVRHNHERLVSEVERAGRHGYRMLRSEAEPTSDEDQMVRLRDMGRILYRLVIPTAMREVIERHPTAPLVVITNDRALAWELMVGDDFVALQRPLARMPIGRSGPRRSLAAEPAVRRRRVALVGSAGEESHLPAVEREIRPVADRLATAWHDEVDVDILLTGSARPADGDNFDRVLIAGDYDIIHYVGYLPDQSGLSLDGGESCSAERIQRLVSGAPLVFLNVSEAARLDEDAPPAGEGAFQGDPREGLASAFLYGGALACIGNSWPVPDAIAAHFAVAFYSHALEGLPLGEAMRLARRSVAKRYPQDPSWASFVFYGDPRFTLGQLDNPPPRTASNPVRTGT